MSFFPGLVSLQPLRLCGVALLFCLPAAAQINLPQADASITLSEATRAALEPALRQAAAARSSVFSVELERSLLDLLPAGLRDACPRVIYFWGDFARDSVRWSVRPLYWPPPPEETGVLLAYRCGSSYPGYADYFDERPAWLRLHPGAAHLRLIPLADNCDNCSDLFRLGFSRFFPLAGGELVELLVVSSSENPCCDGPSAFREERLLYVVLPEASTALSVVRQSERYEHDDADGDWGEICSSSVIDALVDDRLVELTLHTDCRINGEKSRQEVRIHRWNAYLRRFETAPEAQP